MKALTEQSLVPCNNSCHTLSEVDIDVHLKQLDNWDLVNKNTTEQIIKTFKFTNFSFALQFTNEISAIAEQENHHPKICLEWGKATVSWWTHSVNGLFINDFIMAAKCDAIYTKKVF